MDKESINHYYRERKTNGNYKQTRAKQAPSGGLFTSEERAWRAWCDHPTHLAPRFPELLSWAGTLSQIISGTAKCLPSSSKSQIKCKSSRTYSTQEGNKRGRASLVAQMERICLQCGRPGFDHWVRKIP